MKKYLAFILLLFAPILRAQNASPLGGVGNLQFFDNNGAPLVSGVVYIYNAGTSTQASIYTDSTGTTLQPNPATFGSGARVSIWLANGTFVKVVLCVQNDGAFCSAGDILFSADQVPIGSSGGSSSSPFTGIFISSTSSPASSGTLRLASGDSICWRNAAGSTNLCISKDANDLLSWAGGSLKLPEVGAPSTVAGFDILWADNTAHRLKALNNGGTAAQYVLSGNDIGTTDNVTALHFGATQIPIGGTPPTITNQSLIWNGTNIAPGGVVYSTASAVLSASVGPVTMLTVGASSQTYRFSFYVDQVALGVGCGLNSTLAMTVTFTDPNAGGAASSNFTGDTIVTNGTIGMIGISSSTAFQKSQTIRAKTGTTITYTMTYTPAACGTSVPTYQIFPILEQLTVG